MAMGRHSAPYIAARQALSAETTAVGAARYVGRVGGLALALGLGAAVAGGMGLAHADGTTDTGAGPTADKPTPNDVDSSTKSKTRKPGLLNAPKPALGSSGGALTGHVLDPGTLSGLIARIPQQIAGLVADSTTGATRGATSPTGGGAAPQVGSRGSTGHSAVFSQPGPTTGGDVTKLAQFRSTVDDVATAPNTGSQPLGVAPSTPDPTLPQHPNVSSFTAMDPGPATVGPAQGVAAQGASVATVVSSLFAALGGTSSGSGGSPPVAPAPIMTAALQLIRRETTTPRLAQIPNFTSIAALLHLPPAPVLPTHPSTPSTTSTPPLPGDVAATPYGNIGKWMLQSNGQISNYGGQPYGGKTLLEPVNVIIVDPNSKSAAESTAKVNWAMSQSGFPPQPLHSGGFMGKINDKIYGQQPCGLISAYSDNLFVVENSHGRLFGPAPAAGGGYVWSGAFSTETAIIDNGRPGHAYVSSNMARDKLARRLLASGQVQSVSYVPLNNAYDTPTTTTGDHDGYAVVIVLK
jgi:hypothetical protein